MAGEDVDGGRLVVDVYGDTSGFGRDVQRRIDAEVARVRANIKVQIDAKGLAADAKKAAAEASKAAAITVKAEVDRGSLQRSLDQAVRAVRATVGVKLTVDRAAFQRDLEATLRSVRPTVGVKLTVDRTAFQRSLEAAIRSVRPSTQVKVLVDKTHLAQQIQDGVARTRPAPVQVDADTAKAEAQIDATSRDRHTTVETDADTATAEAQIDATARPREATINVKANTSQLSQIGTQIMRVSKLPAIVGGIGALVTVVSQLAGGLFAMGAAASQAAGALAIIPNLVGVAAQGLGTLLAGFSGIGEAVKQLGAAETASAASSQAAADARVAAAQQVKAAQQAVADAHRNVVRTEVAGAQAIVAAEQAIADARRNAAQTAQQGAQAIRQAQQSVVDAHRQGAQAIVAAEQQVESAEYAMAQAIDNTRRAQEALTQAREDAQERLEDLELAMARSRLDEEAGILAVERARERLNEVNRDPMSSDLDRREAALAYQQAIQSLKEIRERNEDLRKEKKEADKEGVNGSQQVQDAHDAVTDALHNQQIAADNLHDAHHNLAQTELQAAQAIAQAQRDVVRVTRDAAQANADAAQQIADAQDALQQTRIQAAQANADAARAELQAQQSLRQTIRDTGDATVETTAAQTALATAMDNLSPAGQRFAQFVVGTLMPRLKDLRFAIQTALLPPIQRGVTAALPFLDVLERGLVGSAKVIGSTVERLGKFIGSGVFGDRARRIMASNNRAMDDFGHAFTSMFRAASNVALAAGPMLERFSKWVRRSAADLRDLINENVGKKGGGDLREWFKTAGDRAAQLGDIIGNVSAALFGLGQGAVPTGDNLLDAFQKTTQGWQDFVESTEGQDKIQAFFESIEPAVEKIGDLAGDLVETFVKLGEAGGGSMTALVTVVDLFVEGLNAALSAPLLGTLITGLIALAGVGGGLALVAGALLKMAGGLLTVARFAAGLLTLNPILLAIIGLGAAFVVAYKNSEQFREVVDRAWDAVKKAVVDAWEGYIRPALEAMWRFIKDDLAPVFTWLWTNAVKPAFKFMGDAIALWWNYYVKPIFTAVKWFVTKVVAPVWGWLWEKVVQPAFKGIGKVIGWWWNNVTKPVFQAVGKFLRDVVGPAFSWLWDKVIKPVFGWIGDKIVTTWNQGIKPVLTTLWKFIKNDVGPAIVWLWDHVVKPMFGKIADVIRWAWNTIIKPVFGAISKAIHGDLSGAFNDLKGVASDVWDAIVDGIRKVPGLIRNLGGKFLDAGKWLISQLGKGLAKAGTFISDIGTSIVNFVIDKLNVAIEGINDALEMDIPGPIGSINPPDIDPIPHVSFATGGRVTGPTHALIGEGKEAETVLPDSLLKNLVSRVAAAAFGGAGGGHHRGGGGKGHALDVGRTPRTGRGDDQGAAQFRKSAKSINDSVHKYVTPALEEWQERVEDHLGPAMEDLRHKVVHPVLKDVSRDFHDFTRGPLRDLDQDWRDRIRRDMPDDAREMSKDVRERTRDVAGTFRDFRTGPMRELSQDWKDRIRRDLPADSQEMKTRVKEDARDTGVVLRDLGQTVKRDVAPKFREGVAAIGTAWSKVEGAAKTPIRYVVNVVLNKGLIGAFNKIAKFVDADTIDAISLPEGFSSGGYTGPGSKDQPAGIVHADEFVVRKEARRRVERQHPGLLDTVNRTGTVPTPREGPSHGGRGGTTSQWVTAHRLRLKGMRDLKGYAKGGLVDPMAHVMWDGEPLTKIHAAQMMIAERLNKHQIHVMQGSWQAPTSYSGTSHTGPGVADISPASWSMQGDLRRAAVTAWRRDQQHGGFSPHDHNVTQLPDRVMRSNGQLQEWRAGGDGLDGNYPDYGPNPPPLKNLAQLLSQFGNIGPIVGGGGGGVPALPGWAQTIVDNPTKWAKGLLDASGGVAAGFGRLTQNLLNSLVPAVGKWATSMLSTYGGGSAGEFGPGAKGTWKSLMSTGAFSKQQAAGIMGNILYESSFNPQNVQNGTGPDQPTPGGVTSGYGLVQWTPGTKLAAYIGANTVSTIANNVDTILAQLKGKGPYPESSAGQHFFQARTPESAASIFELEFERHSGAAQPQRLQAARRYFQQYAARGAMLKAGMNQVISTGGERVLTAAQSNAFEAMAKAAERTAKRKQNIGRVMGPIHGGPDHPWNWPGYQDTFGRGPGQGGHRDHVYRIATGGGHANLVDHGGGGRPGTVFEEGAIQMTINNPAPEPASTSVNARLRTLAAFGLFESG